MLTVLVSLEREHDRFLGVLDARCMGPRDVNWR
jgi:hypothetical protein